MFQREQTLSNKKVAGLEKELSKQQPQEDALKESVRRLAKRAERNAKEEAKLKNDLAAQQSLLEELRRSHELGGAAAEVHRARGIYLLMQSGRVAEGLKHLELARETDPTLPFLDRPVGRPDIAPVQAQEGRLSESEILTHGRITADFHRWDVSPDLALLNDAPAGSGQVDDPHEQPDFFALTVAVDGKQGVVLPMHQVRGLTPCTGVERFRPGRPTVVGHGDVIGHVGAAEMIQHPIQGDYAIVLHFAQPRFSRRVSSGGIFEEVSAVVPGLAVVLAAPQRPDAAAGIATVPEGEHRAGPQQDPAAQLDRRSGLLDQLRVLSGNDSRV